MARVRDRGAKVASSVPERPDAARSQDLHSQSVLPNRYRFDSVSVLSNLTQRDLDICLDIFDHRFLTTTQVYQLHFSTHARARVRLHELYLLGLVNRFRPPKRPGSWPWHYVLDKLGADIVSHARGIDANKLHLRKSRHLALVNSPRLDHMRQVKYLKSSARAAAVLFSKHKARAVREASSSS